MRSISVKPIGFVHSTRKEARDDNWDVEKASVELDASQFAEEALAGLSEFSHVEIIFYMDKVDRSKIQKVSRRPRNNAQWPSIGIFAQRAKGSSESDWNVHMQDRECKRASSHG